MQRFETTEQRTQQRNPVSFTIRISGEDGEAVHCQALNLSVSGMLLDHDGSGLAIGSQIDLVACIRNRRLEVPATVIHGNSNCTGIMFRSPQPDLYRAVAGSVLHSRLSISSRAPAARGARR